MHARRLLELGARIALSAPRYVRESIRPSPTGLHEYWMASQQRFDIWDLGLTPFTPTSVPNPVSRAAWSRTLRPLLEEIFTGELLTRVWTAVGAAHARTHRYNDCEPGLRSILLNHLEMRTRALNCLVYGSGLESRQVVELHQVRRRVERWTDLLFGEMQREIDVAEFACEPRRVRDYARTSPARFSHADRASDLLTDDGLIESLRESFATALSPTEANPLFNQKVATSVLGCFQGEWLDSLEWSPGQWLSRLDHASSDALLWINDILSLDSPRTPRAQGRRKTPGDE